MNCWRENTPAEKRVEYDLCYSENWSIVFDIKILWITLWKGFLNQSVKVLYVEK